MANKLSDKKKVNNYKNIIITSIIISVFFISFSCKRNGESPRLKINDSMGKIIGDYMKEYPQFNNFFLREFPVLFNVNSSQPVLSGFLLGPGYDKLSQNIDFMGNSDLSVCFDFGENKKVYYISDFSSILDPNADSKEFSKVADSMTLGEKYPVKITNQIELFFNRAIFIQVKNGQFRINHRPDTIFLIKPADIEFSAPIVKK